MCFSSDCWRLLFVSFLKSPAKIFGLGSISKKLYVSIIVFQSDYYMIQSSGMLSSAVFAFRILFSVSASLGLG